MDKRALDLLFLVYCLGLWGVLLVERTYTSTIWKTHAFSLGSYYATCFSPGNHCTQKIVSLLDLAKESIDVQAYSFTSIPILNALIRAHKRGVKIMVLLDKSNLHAKYSVMRHLKDDSIPFLIDDKPAIAHNKVMIIDNKIVLTGSFNFTMSADKRNAENVIVIKDPEVVKVYTQNFEYRKKQSKKLKKL